MSNKFFTKIVAAIVIGNANLTYATMDTEPELTRNPSRGIPASHNYCDNHDKIASLIKKERYKIFKSARTKSSQSALSNSLRAPAAKLRLRN